MKKERLSIIRSSAELSEDRNHRYALGRIWDHTGSKIMFIGLNPSRADATRTDATITRCVNFAQDWGFGGMFFANLYSYRTPYVHGPIEEDKQIEKDGPDKGKVWIPLIEKLDDAVGPDCNDHLRFMIDHSLQIVCAWGSWPFLEKRAQVIRMLIEAHGKVPHVFGLNSNGSPKHPLYLSSKSIVTPWKIEQPNG